MTDYITESEFLSYVKSNATTGNTVITTCISAASRQIDAYCGRVFSNASETNYFSPTNNLWVVDFGDKELASTSGLAVLGDPGNNGTYAETWTLDTHFVVEPLNRTRNGLTWPYTRLVSKLGKPFPFRTVPWAPDTMKVTGTFGWTAVPPPVVQATKIVSALYWKMQDHPLGVAGFSGFGEVRVRDLPQAATLLAPFRKASAHGFA